MMLVDHVGIRLVQGLVRSVPVVIRNAQEVTVLKDQERLVVRIGLAGVVVQGIVAVLEPRLRRVH